MLKEKQNITPEDNVITLKTSGSFNNIEKYLRKSSRLTLDSLFDIYGKRGVELLKQNTPIDSGDSANSWEYIVEKKTGFTNLSWHNKNINDGVPVVILIQYGHATKNGSFVEGRDFINPALKPVFENMIEELWKEVTRI